MIMLISLNSDKERRSSLAKTLPCYYSSFNHISAVNGKALLSDEYYRYISSYFRRKEKLLSPAEVGCFLSHQNALRHFLSSNFKYALVLEDDVIMNDESIDLIREACALLPNNSLFMPGGQNGLPSRRYLLGKSTPLPYVCRLHKYSGRHLWRTCCYVLDRTAAEQILVRTKDMATVADDWRYFFKDSDPSYFYANLVHHPLDLKASHIEKYRLENAGRGPSNCSQLIDLLRRAYLKLKSEILRVFVLLSGYRKIINDQD